MQEVRIKAGKESVVYKNVSNFEVMFQDSGRITVYFQYTKNCKTISKTFYLTKHDTVVLTDSD